MPPAIPVAVHKWGPFVSRLHEYALIAVPYSFPDLNPLRAYEPLIFSSSRTQNSGQDIFAAPNMFYNPKFCQMLEAGAQILGNTHLVIERINHQEVSVESVSMRSLPI